MIGERRSVVLTYQPTLFQTHIHVFHLEDGDRNSNTDQYQEHSKGYGTATVYAVVQAPQDLLKTPVAKIPQRDEGHQVRST